MKCQWQDCLNESTNAVIRVATSQEQQECASGEGFLLNVPKYFKKNVCDDCLEEATKEFPLTEEEAVF